AIFDRYVEALDKAGFAQSLAERSLLQLNLRTHAGCKAAEEADHRQFYLLLGDCIGRTHRAHEDRGRPAEKCATLHQLPAALRRSSTRAITASCRTITKPRLKRQIQVFFPVKPVYLRDAEPVSTVEPSVLEDCRPICGSREGRCAGAKSAIITPEEQM